MTIGEPNVAGMQDHLAGQQHVQRNASSSPLLLRPYPAHTHADSATLNQRPFSSGFSTIGQNTMGSHYAAQELGSISPNPTSAVVGEHLRSGGDGSNMGSPSQLSSMMMHNPKRAYRQRRKDPSCDACRERKVKCDATETSSCTECSSRNVRCQFTKDTNRRMSSIKQVQDLERQLLDTRQQLDRIRAQELKAGSYSDQAIDSTAQAMSEVPALGRSPRRMLKARTPQDLAHARTQLSDFGRGLLKPPVTGPKTLSMQQTTSSTDLQSLPPRDSADHYLHFYFECNHRQFPVLHWQSFQDQYTQIYENAESNGPPSDWLGMLFVVLACGALSTRDTARLPEAQEFLTKAVSTMNFWEDEISINQAIVAFLASVFLAEVNRKSASWIWLGSAIRVAQDLGLHVQGGQWSSVEGEMRKRVWYSFYIWDR